MKKKWFYQYSREKTAHMKSYNVHVGDLWIIFIKNVFLKALHNEIQNCLIKMNLKTLNIYAEQRLMSSVEWSRPY